MLPGTSDINHDFILPKPKQNYMEKPNELKTICKTTRGSWTLRLKFLLEEKKTFDLQARRWLISEVPGSIDEAFVCFACGTTLYELNKV